jgi:hypothetical protein
MAFRRIRCRLMDEENVIPLVRSGQQRIDNKRAASELEGGTTCAANCK